MSEPEGTIALELALEVGDDNEQLSKRLRLLAGSDNEAALLSAIHEGQAFVAVQAEARRQAAAERMAAAVPEAPPREEPVPAEQDDEPEPAPEPEPESEPAEIGQDDDGDNPRVD